MYVSFGRCSFHPWGTCLVSGNYNFVLFIIVCGFADFGFIVVGYNCLDVIHAVVT